MMRPRPTLDSGSMFVEAIIAAAIVALALGSTYQAIASSAARDRGVEIRRTALLIAQSELADVGAEIALEPGRTSGVAGNLVWQVDIAPYPEGGATNAAGAVWKVTVSVRARAGGADLVALKTLRLGRQA